MALMTSKQIQTRVHKAIEGSGVPKTEVANLLRANFDRGSASFRWVNDLFAGKPVTPLGGSEASVGVFVEFLSEPSQASAVKAKKALEKAAGGKTPAAPRVQTVPGSPRQRVTTGGGIEKKPRGGKAQFIKPRASADWSAGAKSAKTRWDAAIDRGADPIDATRRRIAATGDKAKLAGIVVMLNAIKPKAGKKPTRAQIKSLAEAAEKKSGYKPPKKTTAQPPKKSKSPTHPWKKVGKQRRWATTHAGLEVNITTVGGLWASGIHGRAKKNFDTWQEAAKHALAAARAAGAKTKPKVTAPKPVKVKLRVATLDFPIWASVWNRPMRVDLVIANFLKTAIRSRSKDRLKEAIALLKTVGSGAKGKERSLFQSATRDLTKRLKSVSPRAKAPGRKVGAVLVQRAAAATKPKPKPKPKKAPAKKRAAAKRAPTRRRAPGTRQAVAQAAERMGVEAALRRGLKRGEKVSVQLDLVFTEA